MNSIDRLAPQTGRLSEHGIFHAGRAVGRLIALPGASYRSRGMFASPIIGTPETIAMFRI
jgi:hypothetical protein